MQSTTAQIAEIRRLAASKDWRYFTFNLGVMQTRGTESAGAKLRRLNAADADAATYSPEDADSIRETYLNLVLPTFDGREDEVDVRRAVLHTLGALRLSPDAR